MQLTYRYRLYPSKEQMEQISKTCGCVRFVYNALLSLRINVYRETGELAKLDEKQIKRENPFLKQVDPSALSWSRKRLEQAYQDVFHKRDKGKMKYRRESIAKSNLEPSYELMDNDMIGYPQLKRKKEMSDHSYTTSSSDVRIENGWVFLPQVGNVKVKMHRPIPENAKCLNYTVLQKVSGHVYLLVCIALPKAKRKTDFCRPLGVVYNPSQLAVRSDEVKVRFQHEEKALRKRIEREYRSLLRRKPGSNGHAAQVKYLASLIEKRTNQQRDNLHKEALQITNAADTLYLETPAVRYRKPRWSVMPGMEPVIMDEAWWMFSEMIRYKALNQGKFIWNVYKYQPLYGICSICNEPVPKIPKQSDWCCPCCGVKIRSELNAARNLENMARQHIEQQQ